MPLTPAQCRAARALLDWTQDELAERAEVSRSTIRGFESGQHALQRSTAAAMCRALAAGGVILVEADRDGGQGVRFVAPAGCVAGDAAGA
jgi:DNA-binding XRE family transcriptional regulator